MAPNDRPQRSDRAKRASESSRLRSQETASWVFGGLLLLFLMWVFAAAPEELPQYKQRLLAFFCASLAGLLGIFVTGTVALKLGWDTTRLGRVSIQAAGGFALFVFILVWWFSDAAPVRVEPEPKVVDDAEKHETQVPPTTPTAPASAGCGTLPSYQEGAADLRVATIRADQATARQRASAFKELLRRSGASDWVPHLSEPVFGAYDGQDVQLLLILGTQPSAVERFCEWMQCVGWDTGVRPCEIRHIDYKAAAATAPSIQSTPPSPPACKLEEPCKRMAIDGTCRCAECALEIIKEAAVGPGLELSCPNMVHGRIRAEARGLVTVDISDSDCGANVSPQWQVKLALELNGDDVDSSDSGTMTNWSNFSMNALSSGPRTGGNRLLLRTTHANRCGIVRPASSVQRTLLRLSSEGA